MGNTAGAHSCGFSSTSRRCCLLPCQIQPFQKILLTSLNALFNTYSVLHFHFLLYAFPLSAILIFTFCFLLPTNHFHFPISSCSTVNLKYEFPLFLFLIFFYTLHFVYLFILTDCSLQLFELLGVVRYQGSWQDVRRKTEQSWLFAKTRNLLLLS